MKRTVLAILTAMTFGIGGNPAVNAGEYTGPGFSGIAWYGENGTANQKLGTINVDKPGFRMEMQEQGQHVVVLVFWDQDVSYSLMMNQKMYMEIPAEETGSAPDDYEGKPCDGYDDAKKIGAETINGRATEKWRCTGELNPAPDQPAMDATNWFDPEIGFPIREAKDNGEIFEIRNVSVARQDASLFEIPPGFQKFDMDAMMQQMMQQPQGQ
ncbi:MAG: DUF4412 domain-containing protein [Rhodospirillales bacterium]|nr:MAG: DUF4412 domain-containing protein [Rhodospirillales bacterium]